VPLHLPCTCTVPSWRGSSALEWVLCRIATGQGSSRAIEGDLLPLGLMGFGDSIFICMHVCTPSGLVKEDV
jgi:hypothetical protein